MERKSRERRRAPRATCERHETDGRLTGRRAAMAAAAACATTAGVRPARANEAAAMIRNAMREPDPEVAIELWSDAVESSAGDNSWFVALAHEGRGLAQLKTFLFVEAASDLAVAVRAFQEALASGVPPAIADVGVTPPWVRVAICLDGLGLASMHLGDSDAALDALKRARAALDAHTDPRTGQDLGLLSVPTYAPSAGLRGSAPTMRQRVDLHYALATWAMGDVPGARRVLETVDLGPDPTKQGLYQFWDARAAIASAAWADGDRGEADLTWQALCAATPSNPPSVPRDPIKARVNAAAQFMLDAEAAMTDRNCEDLDSGTYLPCDDAGIPGLAGSSAPCMLYSADEVRARLWPSRAYEALDALRLNRS